MRVLQVLPELNSGGVERGTVELGRELVARGHESWVMSNGGRLVADLEAQGSRHITRPVHRKSPRSLLQIAPVQRLLRQVQPDIVHVRSRLPAWIIWLAWRRLPARHRPGLVSTFHGLYSVNRYSAIMARGERLIAVSDCVADYVRRNYTIDEQCLSVIPRGVDTGIFYPGPPDAGWLARIQADFPELQGRRLVLMPGRLSRWKGQLDFLHVMAQLVQQHPDCHGVLLGDADSSKSHYRRELEEGVRQLGLSDHITFTGHRADINQWYRAASLVCHLSRKPEPFGRTLTEALACGTPVVAYSRGGAAESLRDCFPQGLVPANDVTAFIERAAKLLSDRPAVPPLSQKYSLTQQVDSTLTIYQSLLEHRSPGPEADRSGT